MIIYKATNLVNGKIYIGQTNKTLEHRKYQHFNESSNKNRKNTHFYNALIKYGKDAFVFEVIDTASSQKELDEKERYWIAYYRSNEREYGYNKDEGGKSGGHKSEETKQKIGLTTKEKWTKEDSANRMLEGLRKGTVTWQEMCKNKRVLFVCPYCGKEEYLPPHLVRKKKACSFQCKKDHGGFREQSIYASSRAAESVHNKNIENKKIIKKDIENWCLKNANLVLNCPKNKIVPALTPLLKLIEDKYNIIDIRSLFVCFEVKNKKDFLHQLQTFLKENIC